MLLKCLQNQVTIHQPQPVVDVVLKDKNGIIQYVEYVPEIGEQPDYERALKVIKELTVQGV